MPHFLVPILRRPEQEYALQVRRTGERLASRLETAFDSTSRRHGWMRRDEAAPESALILAPCSSIHTAFMRFPIDALFVARDGRVIRVAPAVRPWRLRMTFWAFAVIELPAGSVGEHGVKAGDVVELVEAA
jgi:uncharacterized protein